MKIFNKFLCLITACAMFVLSANVSIASEKSFAEATDPGKISVKVNNADLRDVLSAIAVNMGYSIIYTGDAHKITVELKNLSPQLAFDYVLKMVNMSYLMEGNTVIVGPKETLVNNFSRSLSLKRFDLHYIKSTVAMEKIKQLNMPVSVITLASNENTLWVQGFPADVAKVNELLYILDIQENFDVDGVNSVDANSSERSLYYLRLKYLSGEEFNSILKAIGVDCGICISQDDGSRSKFYVYATPQQWKTVQDIREKMDDDNGYNLLSVDNLYEIINDSKIIGTLNFEDAVKTINAAFPDVKVVTTGNFKNRTIMLVGDNAYQAKLLLQQLNTSAAELQEYFNYSVNLRNMSAKEAVRRLENMTFDYDVKFYTGRDDSYGEFSNVLYFYCPSHYSANLKAVINKMDDDSAKMLFEGNVPILTADSKTSAENMGTNLSKLIGKTVEFTVIELDTKTFVLCLKDGDASTLAMLDTMLERLNSISSGGYTGLSYNDYLTWTADPANAALLATIDTYEKWLTYKLSSGRSGFSLSYSNPLGTPVTEKLKEENIVTNVGNYFENNILDINGRLTSWSLSKEPNQNNMIGYVEQILTEIDSSIDYNDYLKVGCYVNNGASGNGLYAGSIYFTAKSSVIATQDSSKRIDYLAFDYLIDTADANSGSTPKTYTDEELQDIITGFVDQKAVGGKFTFVPTEGKTYDASIAANEAVNYIETELSKLTGGVKRIRAVADNTLYFAPTNAVDGTASGDIKMHIIKNSGTDLNVGTVSYVFTFPKTQG